MGTETFVQADRLLSVTTPLGKDALLLVGLTGREALSQLFSFRLELLAARDKVIPFDQLLAQKMTVRLTLPDGSQRFLNGICSLFSQAEQEDRFTNYRAEIVPAFWLLTRKVQSRIFQNQSVPDILAKVLTGLDIVVELRGTFHPRDYCVQYRESDFQFASRLMEEEGIYYFFKHTDGNHTMVLANTPQSHPDVPYRGRITYQNLDPQDLDEEGLIFNWEKIQELRSGKVTLWDHSFELPHKHLEAEKKVLDSVPVGQVAHKLQTGGNDKLEIFDWPGEYAQRYDGVGRGGDDRTADLQKIFEDNQRTAEIRMQQETTPGLVIQGDSNCRQFVSGHKFTLANHFNADGPYLLTSVAHSVRLGQYRTGDPEVSYHNGFTCLPLALPFRPARVTPKPSVQGSQSAVVVGPAGEEIFTDKYGRVKVQFHWDREGKNDANSSCWVRVSTAWAGKQWGLLHIPRVGQEVIVDFLEGDPDQPIIVGSVFNAEMMPPYQLPENRTQSGLKTRSTPKGEFPNFNELRFEDKKGAEYIYFHAERDFNRAVENNDTLLVAGNRSIVIAKGDEFTRIKLGKSEKEALQSIELRVGKNSIKVDPTGITLKGLLIKIEGEVQTILAGTSTFLRGAGLLKLEGPVVMTGPVPVTPGVDGLDIEEEEPITWGAVGAVTGRGAGGPSATVGAGGPGGAGAQGAALPAGAPGVPPPAGAPGASAGSGPPAPASASPTGAPGAPSPAGTSAPVGAPAGTPAPPAAGAPAGRSALGPTGAGKVPAASPLSPLGAGAAPPGAGQPPGGAGDLPDVLTGLPSPSTQALADVLKKTGISGISPQALGIILNKASSTGMSAQALGDLLRRTGASGVTSSSLADLLRQVRALGDNA